MHAEGKLEWDSNSRYRCNGLINMIAKKIAADRLGSFASYELSNSWSWQTWLYSLISSLFCFALKLLTNAHYILRDYCTAAGYRALYVVLFDLKPLTKMATGKYVRTAWKGASEAPRTNFRACKIVKFPEGMAPDPPQAIYSIGPTFCICPGPPLHNRLGGPGCKGVAVLFLLCLDDFIHSCACFHYHKPVATMHNLLHPSTWLFLVQVEINKHPCPQAVPLESEGFWP